MTHHMISISQAEDIIRQSVRPLPPRRMPLSAVLGLTLAEEVVAACDIPAFPQSSMDGYAFAYPDWAGSRELKISGVIAAGDRQPCRLSPGTAVRIFTGAAVPEGADTVVMQEKVQTADGKLVISDGQLQPGSNVRPRGSEIRTGALALEAGTTLTTAAIGFLAGIGHAEVVVYPRPSISLIITGSELQRPGGQLEYGQVYESNSSALLAALEQMHIRDVKVVEVDDDPDMLTMALHTALEESDLTLLTGGISVGDYDFVLQAAAACRVVPAFYKVRQRPGKPLFMGKREAKVVFGLPGNPSSVLTCFYMYVVPALGLLSKTRTDLRTVRAPLAGAHRKPAGLTHFFKGNFDGEQAYPLGAQESYRMHSFARSNCLIRLDEDQTDLPEGTLVTVHLLPVC